MNGKRRNNVFTDSRIRFADNTERYKSNRGLRLMQLFLL